MVFTINQRQAALLSGWSIIIMALAAIPGMAVVLSPIFEMNEQQFVAQISHIRPLFWIGIVSWVLILVCDVLASYGLYVYYKKEAPRRSAIMGTLRFAYSIFLLIAIVYLFMAQGAMNASDPNLALAYQHIFSFQRIWYLGLIVFGVHLLYLSMLSGKPGMFLKVLSYIIAFAGFGYVLSNTLGLFVNNYASIRGQVEAVFIIPMTVGEIALAIWLVAKGGKVHVPKLAQSVS